jgi:hypothetical protein
MLKERARESSEAHVTDAMLTCKVRNDGVPQPVRRFGLHASARLLKKGLMDRHATWLACHRIGAGTAL